MAVAQVLSQNLPTTSYSSGTYPPQQGGKLGQGIVGQMNGQYAHASLSGNVFFGSTLAAGIVVPFNAATLVSKFTLHNPAGSGKNVELIDINVLQVPGSALITGLGLGFQGPLANTGGVPTSLTTSAGLTGPAVIGSGTTPKAILYTAATLTNVAIANLAPIMWLFNNVATTVITQQFLNYQFNGKVILPPDTLCTLCNSITGTQSASPVTISWAEWPL